MVSVSEIWKTLNEGVIGYVFYILLGAFAAVVLTSILGLVLNTNIPLVAVLSGSMDHGITDEPGSLAYPCAKRENGYEKNFDSWWRLCGRTYSEFGITKEGFAHFPFRDGFSKGDIPVIMNDGSFAVGDVIVYDIQSQKVPIIHRIVKVNEDGTFQTKGDHNSGQNPYERAVSQNQIRGKVVFLVPYLGYLRTLIPIN
jgi:signal peptidase I